MKRLIGTSLRDVSKTYVQDLDAAWRDHLAPRRKNAPTVVQLFAGGGGSSLGFSMAGYRELLAVEWDAKACATLRLNFPHTPIYEGDIALLTNRMAGKMTGLKPGELDVLSGSPPCQSFSTAGKRKADDPRGQLYHEYIRLLRYFRPKKLVMENVTGMIKGEMRDLFFNVIMRDLRACGYNVQARVLNAMHYGVPQARQRVIFIGSRVGEPKFPAPWSEPITVRDAWAGFNFDGTAMMVTAGNERHTKAGRTKPWTLDNPSPTLLASGNHVLQQHFSVPKPGSKMLEGGPKYKGLKNAKEGEKINYIAERLAFDKVCNTIRTGDGTPCSGWYSHPTEMRGISLEEAKRIGSFPDQFIFFDWKAGCGQIGNCVPPLLMRAIAEVLAKHGGTGEMTDFKRTTYARTKPGAKARGVLGLFTRLAWNIVAPTVMRQFGVYGVAGLYHPDEPRPLTVGEYRRIASFPDGFRFGAWLDAVAQMGNCVPPPAREGCR